jgi:hypothetical protein
MYIQPPDSKRPALSPFASLRFETFRILFRTRCRARRRRRRRNPLPTPPHDYLATLATQHPLKPGSQSPPRPPPAQSRCSPAFRRAPAAARARGPSTASAALRLPPAPRLQPTRQEQRISNRLALPIPSFPTSLEICGGANTATATATAT